MKTKHTLTLSFPTRQALAEFVRDHLEHGIAVYEADTLDPEYSGNPGTNSYVLRREGAKPEDMRVC
jgi:hypothetical protein